jgi:adenylate cyclase
VTEVAGARPESLATRHIWVVGLLTLAGLAVAIVLITWWDARLQALWFDAYQRVAARKVESLPAVVVEIDERSLQAVGQWPWPRTILASLLRDIERAEPLVIGVDIVMPEADRMSPERLLERARRDDPVLAEHLAPLPSNDTELAKAIAAGPVVLAVVGSDVPTQETLRATPLTIVDEEKRGDVPNTMGQYRGALPSIDELDRVARGHGLISVGKPANEVIRRMPLVSNVNGTLAPALAVEMLRVGEGANSLRLRTAGTARRGITIGNLTAPTEDDGSMRIYYSPHLAGRSISAIDVLEGRVDSRKFRGRYVLIGVTGLALADFQNTPLGIAMPGSEIHAQVLENLIERTWLSRLHAAPAIELGVFVLMGLLLIWATPLWKPRNSALLAAACVAAMVAAALALFYFERQLFDAATPGVALMILYSTLLALTLAEATRRRRSLERVVQAQREQAAVVTGELLAAQRIQTGILPRAESLRHERRIDLAASMIPAREVGGDLYDFFLLDGERLFFLAGDVAGKGLSASIFMAISKALYKSATLRQPHAAISDLMRAANEEVSRDNPETFFVTVFAGILDLTSGELTYCNAGHENPYVLGGDVTTPARLTEGAGPPLCTVDGFAYDSARYALRAGDLLCVVTDGIVDAQNGHAERYGSMRLGSLLTRLRTSTVTARDMADAVLADVKSFVGGADPADDLTVLVLRWVGSSPTR